MPTTLVTAAAEEPVTLTEVKQHLRVDIDDDDFYLQDLIAAARQHVEENVLSSALITQTWDYIIDDWPGDVITLPKPPLQSVTSVKYTDEDDNELTVSSSDYRVDTDSFPGRIVLKTSASWPTVELKEFGGVVVRFVAGYGLEAAVPPSIKAAIKLIIGDLYENRENTLVAQGITVATLPYTAHVLLQNYRHKVF